MTFTPCSAKRRFCTHACYAASLRGARLTNYRDQRMMAAKGHPIAPPCGTVARARLVLYEKIGPGPHTCHWCDTTIDWKTGLVPGCLVADHLNWNRSDDRPENLAPSCTVCNSHRAQKGNKDLIREDEPTLPRGRGRTRAIERQCEICQVRFLTIPAEVAKGKGRTCSRSCARRLPRGSHR